MRAGGPAICQRSGESSREPGTGYVSMMTRVEVNRERLVDLGRLIKRAPIASSRPS